MAFFKKKVKRTSTCPYCHQEILPNRAYCDFCGKALPSEFSKEIGKEKHGRDRHGYLKDERLNSLLDVERETIYDLYKSK